MKKTLRNAIITFLVQDQHLSREYHYIHYTCEKKPVKVRDINVALTRNWIFILMNKSLPILSVEKQLKKNLSSYINVEANYSIYMKLSLHCI